MILFVGDIYIAAWLSGITFASKAKIESSILSAAVCASGSVVEHRLAKARAAGSNPVSRFKDFIGSPFLLYLEVIVCNLHIKIKVSVQEKL